MPRIDIRDPVGFIEQPVLILEDLPAAIVSDILFLCVGCGEVVGVAGLVLSTSIICAQNDKYTLSIRRHPRTEVFGGVVMPCGDVWFMLDYFARSVRVS